MIGVSDTAMLTIACVAMINNIVIHVVALIQAKTADKKKNKNNNSNKKIENMKILIHYSKEIYICVFKA